MTASQENHEHPVVGDEEMFDEIVFGDDRGKKHQLGTILLCIAYFIKTNPSGLWRVWMSRHGSWEYGPFILIEFEYFDKTTKTLKIPNESFMYSYDLYAELYKQIKDAMKEGQRVRSLSKLDFRLNEVQVIRIRQRIADSDDYAGTRWSNNDNSTTLEDF